VLNDIVSYVRLLLFQQPDNTHGIYHHPHAEACCYHRELRKFGCNGFKLC
jgi:hypothetical protein